MPNPAEAEPRQARSRSGTACVGCAALHCAHSVAVSHTDDAASVVLSTQGNASERRSSALRSGFVIRRRKEDASKLLGEMVAARWDDITTKADRSAVDLLRKEAPDYSAGATAVADRPTDRGNSNPTWRIARIARLQREWREPKTYDGGMRAACRWTGTTRT